MSLLKELEEEVLSDPSAKQAYSKEVRIDKISILLKQLREDQSITQSEVANRTGLSQQMISKLECYNGNPSLSTFIKFCNSINIDLEKVIMEYYTNHVK